MRSSLKEVGQDGLPVPDQHRLRVSPLSQAGRGFRLKIARTIALVLQDRIDILVLLRELPGIRWSKYRWWRSGVSQMRHPMLFGFAKRSHLLPRLACDRYQH